MKYDIPPATGDIHGDLLILLVVDDFGIRYEENEHALHLLQMLCKYYEAISVDWRGTL